MQGYTESINTHTKKFHVVPFLLIESQTIQGWKKSSVSPFYRLSWVSSSDETTKPRLYVTAGVVS